MPSTNGSNSGKTHLVHAFGVVVIFPELTVINLNMPYSPYCIQLYRPLHSNERQLYTSLQN